MCIHISLSYVCTQHQCTKINLVCVSAFVNIEQDKAITDIEMLEKREREGGREREREGEREVVVKLTSRDDSLGSSQFRSVTPAQFLTNKLCPHLSQLWHHNYTSYTTQHNIGSSYCIQPLENLIGTTNTLSRFYIYH